MTDPQKPGLRAILRDAWRLAIPYFRSEERWSARILLVLIIAMNFSLVGMNVILNYWNGAFFDSLQNKNQEDFINLLLTWRVKDGDFMPGFVPIVCIYIPIAIYRTWLTQWLQIRWRRWMTESLLADWLGRRAYYTIALQHAPNSPTTSLPATDNPDQRIAEDLNTFTSETLSLVLNLLKTIVTLISFAQILWSLSGALTILGITIPGYLLFVAIVYAVLGTWLTHLIGKPLAGIEFRKQKVEADFRFNLIRIRENAEGIALYAGEHPEQRSLIERFAAIVANWRQYMNRNKYLNAMSAAYEQVASIFPFVVAAPRYFAGEITLGGLTRIASAFAQVQSALSWIIDSYPRLAALKATIDRLTGFRNAIAAAHALAGAGVQTSRTETPSLTLEDVTLKLPDGRTLLEAASLTLPQGHSAVLSGRSGSGKSTLFRAIAGIWPFGAGTVHLPAAARVLFLPQRPYIPLGTLRQAVTYPAEPGTIPDGAVAAALTDAGLAALIPELDTDQPWTQRLSGGEQQRLAIARALLQKPDWLFLDEATASLDPEAEAELYQILRDRLPNTTILSIAHHPELAKWHTNAITLRDGQLRIA